MENSIATPRIDLKGMHCPDSKHPIFLSTTMCSSPYRFKLDVQQSQRATRIPGCSENPRGSREMKSKVAAHRHAFGAAISGSVFSDRFATPFLCSEAPGRRWPCAATHRPAPRSEAPSYPPRVPSFNFTACQSVTETRRGSATRGGRRQRIVQRNGGEAWKKAEGEAGDREKEKSRLPNGY